MAYSNDIFQLILNFISISIIIRTAIIVVKKRCNKILREHDDARAAMGTPIDKYERKKIHFFCAGKFYSLKIEIWTHGSLKIVKEN
jgi:hypothetical protein